MANVFLNLPTTAANGAGTAIDVSSMGATKTIVYAPTDSTVGQPFITIEISNDTAGNEWSELYQFKAPGEYTVNVACHRMRATTSNYRAGSAAAVDVGASDDGALFAELVAPAGNGNGAAVDVSALGILKTIQVTDSFLGTLNIEVSEDGGTSWAEIASFVNAGGIKTLVIASEFMRVKRANVPTVNPGLPTIWIGGADLGGHEDGGVALSAGSQSVSTGTVLFASSNGVSYGMSGSSQVTARVASVIATGAENAVVTGASNVSLIASNQFSVSAKDVKLSAGVSGGISLIAGATSDSEGMLISAVQNISVTGGRLDVLVTGNDGALIRADNTATAKGYTLSAASGSAQVLASNALVSASGSLSLIGAASVLISASSSNGVLGVSVGSQVDLLAGTGAEIVVDHNNGVAIQNKSNGKLGFYNVAAVTRPVVSTSTDLTAWVSRLNVALVNLGLVSTV